MSRLAEFLLAKEPLFDHALRQLEERTHKHGVDAALTAEIAQKAASLMAKLGLDQTATAPELYKALIELVEKQDKHLVEKLGGSDVADVHTLIPLVVERALKVDVPRRGYFIKEEVAANLIRQTPPIHIMARLGYSDVEAMLAKESIYEIYVALRFGEDPDWVVEFNKTTNNLTAADFTERDIRLVPFDADKWGDIAKHFIEKKLHNITNSKEMGVIAVMPMTIDRMPGIALKDLALIMHYYNEIRLYSSFFKLVKGKKNFGDIVADTLIADPPRIKMAGHAIHWRVIQRYFGKDPAGHPEIFEPHLHPEDLHWRKAEEVLYDIDSELEFWRDMDYVAVMLAGEPVTFNLMDVSFSYSNAIPFSKRYLYHFRESLWNEIFARYFGQRTLREQLLIKLDNAVVSPEKL